jgi:hypothetical protein
MQHGLSQQCSAREREQYLDYDGIDVLGNELPAAKEEERCNETDQRYECTR